MPPYLAGREPEQQEFVRLLEQKPVMQNLILTGLRGVGKTVLLETLKPLAIQRGWLWTGTDLSESTSVSELSIATRVLADLALVTSSQSKNEARQPALGFEAFRTEVLDFATLSRIFQETPGLAADKLKQVLEVGWEHLKAVGRHGVVFAYDEAQTLADHSAKEQYPLSLLLDVFQSLQRKGLRYLLVLTGLPTLFPRLVEVRTYSERMFRILFLDRLTTADSRQAILKPLQALESTIQVSDELVDQIVEISGGYPYFLQFVCREVFDLAIQRLDGSKTPRVPVEEVLRKLDSDFFAGRWARATDRQRALLSVAARLPNASMEFTVQELVGGSRRWLERPFSGSHVNQMLTTLAEAGLVYKNRHGRYSFAVPLLHRFILRQLAETELTLDPPR